MTETTMKNDRTKNETRLLRLVKELGSPNQKELASELGVSPPTLRPLLSLLEGHEWIQRDFSRLPHIIWRVTKAGDEELSTRQAMANALTESSARHRSKA